MDENNIDLEPTGSVNVYPENVMAVFRNLLAHLFHQKVIRV